MIPARPSHTAFRVARHRAAHQLLDDPLVFADPLALPILGAEVAAQIRADPQNGEGGPLAAYLRAFLAVRHRFVEDRLANARAAGIRQYVILGAGLDTFAYRMPAAPGPLRVWEVDHPATQAWKRERLQEAGIAVPPSLCFVPIDFEHETLATVLAAAGLDLEAGAVFSWLGVTPYLARQTILETLRYIALATRGGGGVAFDYAIAPHLLTLPQRVVFETMAARVRAAGEPWQSSFEPAELAETLRGLGFASVEDVPPATLNARYFAGRSDGMHVGGLAHLMWAGSNHPVA
jgi:methyltransferase (TIGR00027 family)